MTSLVSLSSSDDSMVAQAVRIFIDQFGKKPEIATFAPGRVNLIGEHTDYNDGFVLPLALPFKTIVVGSISPLPTARVYSCNVTNPQDCLATFAVSESLSKGKPKWANYVKGTVYQYLKELPKYFSFDAVVISNVPIGSGLSSSASLEVAIAVFLEKLCGLTISGVDRALRCQQAEHTFADTPCGIMDQYISSMGKKGSLLLIDCRSKEYRPIELVPPGRYIADPPVILITNSNVKHTLSGSEYPDRVAQCKSAISAIQSRYPHVKALRDVTTNMLGEFQDSLSDLVFRRAGHSVTEDARTLEAVKAIAGHDYETVGNLMTESHNSLRDNYEVSCEELDILVNLALQVPGVYGSRMTGGGFGGCTVTLVKKSAINQLKLFLGAEYKNKTGIDCEFYEAVPSEGASAFNIAPFLNEPSKDNWMKWLIPGIGILTVGIIVYTFSARLSPKNIRNI